MVVIVNI